MIRTVRGQVLQKMRTAYFVMALERKDALTVEVGGTLTLSRALADVISVMDKVG